MANHCSARKFSFLEWQFSTPTWRVGFHCFLMWQTTGTRNCCKKPRILAIIHVSFLKQQQWGACASLLQGIIRPKQPLLLHYTPALCSLYRCIINWSACGWASWMIWYALSMRPWTLQELLHWMEVLHWVDGLSMKSINSVVWVVILQVKGWLSPVISAPPSRKSLKSRWPEQN